MLKRFFASLMRRIFAEELETWRQQSLAEFEWLHQTYRETTLKSLELDRTYILLVPDEHSAEEYVREIERWYRAGQFPRMLILSGEGMRLMAVTPKKTP